jgi:hypothetical protein
MWRAAVAGLAEPGRCHGVMIAEEKAISKVVVAPRARELGGRLTAPIDEGELARYGA